MGCPICGQPVPAATGNRPRIYCSTACSSKQANRILHGGNDPTRGLIYNDQIIDAHDPHDPDSYGGHGPDELDRVDYLIACQTANEQTKQRKH